MKRILHIDNSQDITGGFKALKLLCDTIQENYTSIIAIKTNSKCIQQLKTTPYRFYEINFIEISKRFSDLLLYFPVLLINGYKLNKIIRTEKIDIIHSNDIFNLTPYISKYIFFNFKPIVVHVRLMPNSFPKLIYQLWKHIHLLLANKIIAVSFIIKEKYNSRSKIQVVYDIPTIKENHKSYTFCFNPDRPFNFLYLANFTYGKGQELAIHAFIKLIKMNPKVNLTFVGGDMGHKANIEYKNNLIKLVQDHQLGDYIKFESFCQDVELKMKQFDAVLNFSHSESFSFTCYEALSYGIPLIASDSGGPAELFENEISGILVTNKSIQEMTDAMYRLSTKPELGTNFSMESKIYIKKICDSNNWGLLTKSIFDTI
jgi:glycosyltransferase involved in cell wall biosynthesis